MRRASMGVVVAFAGWAAGSALATEQGVEQVSWLAGCWQGQFGEPGTVEQWLSPAGGTMLGVSRTVRQGRTVEFEFMQLRLLPDGVLAFIAQPSGRPPTAFRAVSLSGSEAVFENPEHDFPQRIRYLRPDASRLWASIEGGRGGALRKLEFSFARVSCDPPAGEAPR